MLKSLRKQAISFSIVISILFSGYHSGHSTQTLSYDQNGSKHPGWRDARRTPRHQTLSDYQHWIKHLASRNYTVVQGNVFLMVNAECPTFVAIFDSCFGNNPAAPYIILQPPIEYSYVDPYYAVPLETPGPEGLTNIIYRLGSHDALVTLISYPPKAAYFGYQSYVFTREISAYAGITPPRPPTVSPDPSRYEIFGSIGNAVNNVIVQNQYGSAPWGGTVVMYITTPNQNLANALMANARSHGINPNSIFVEPVGSNVITGNDASADDMLTLMRYAVPESTSAASDWQNALSSNVLVYKVTNTDLAVSRFGANQYTAHVSNTDETGLTTALQQLAALLQTYLADTQTPIDTAASHQTEATTEDDANGIPTSGLVGASCIAYGVNCEGDNQDTSTYATLINYVLLLGPEETAFIAGVNHSVESVNNNHYISVDIYNASNSSGVASASQTNPTATGFDSGFLTGSAQQVLTALGITIPPEDTELTENISKLYVTFIARNCNNSTIAAASAYCIDLMGRSLIPLDDPISIIERSYVVPGMTTGGYPPEMVYPYIIAATHSFIAK
jgi:hypothetical protein